MKYCIITFFTFFSILTKAQQIKGIVTDAVGMPIVNCTVKIKNSTAATATNIDGKFAINYAHQNSPILSFSSVGYITIEKLITKKDTSIIIVLEAQKTELYQIVVVSAMGKKGIKMKGTPSFKKVENNRDEENTFIKTSLEPFSTFSIDDDKASYSYIRRNIKENLAVPIDVVKLEEMINYFDYNYEAKDNNAPYNFNTELTTCPWNTGHQLMKIALKSSSVKSLTDMPANYVFLIDVSGSMKGEDRLPLVKKSLLMLLDSLSKDDMVSIITYAGKSGVALEATEVSDKKTIINAINKLNTGGKTAGSDGINLAYEIAETHKVEDGNNRVILATDGDFNVGLTKFSDLERLISEKKETGIFLTCLGFGTGNYKDKTMELLADKGNGNYYYISDTMEAKRVLQKDFKGTIHTIAKDVKIQVEFNTHFVREYRLLGYENRLLDKEDFKNDAIDAGEMGEGHTVTALYELVPHSLQSDEIRDSNSTVVLDKETINKKNNIATIRTRYKLPEGSKSKKLDFDVLNKQTDFIYATNNTKWASCVAMFGMLLTNSPFKGSGSKEIIIEIAKQSLNVNDTLQIEFIQLVEKWGNKY
jgi:Ca-activated chloride channel homolog